MDDIIVCVKQVPDTEHMRFDPQTHTSIREGKASILNPLDRYALNAALDCKDKYGTKVGVVTMGPEQAMAVLTDCLEYGADEAFLLSDIRLAGCDTLATARVLYAFIKQTAYKNIFCGQETIDSTTGHIGPSLAEWFKWPQANYACEIIRFYHGIMCVKTRFDNVSQFIEVTPPVVASFIKTRKRLRTKTRRVGKESLRILGLKEIGLDDRMVGIEGSPTRIVSMHVNDDDANYVTVNNRLPAHERITYILNGGIQENKDRIVLNNTSDESIDEVIKLLP